MVFLAQNLKRPVWVASSAMVDGVRCYGAPVLYHWNWRALSSSVDMMTFGPEYLDYRKAVTDNSQVDGIKRLDRVWMDSAPTDPSDPLASDADFYVLSVDKGAGGFADVTFKRLNPDA
jgi:hypothetical protein